MRVKTGSAANPPAIPSGPRTANDDVIAAAPYQGEAAINIINTRPETPNAAIISITLSIARLTLTLETFRAFYPVCFQDSIFISENIPCMVFLKSDHHSPIEPKTSRISGICSLIIFVIASFRFWIVSQFLFSYRDDSTNSPF